MSRARAAVGTLLVLLGACGGDDRPADACAIEGGGGGGPGRLLDGPMCTYLSSYGFFTDLPAQQVDPAMIPYDLVTPLFSDYTAKRRYVWLPDGEAMAWSDELAFALPVGAMIIKTFSYPVDAREPSLGARLLETRVMVHRASGWEGASYVYDEDGREAELAAGARTIDVSWIDGAGATRSNTYVTPSRNQCINCHAAEQVDVMGPIGPKARHLNRDVAALDDGADPTWTGNQLEAMIGHGVLTGAPADPASWPKATALDDERPEAIEARARSWLDINCAHCHNPAGAARTSGLDLRAANDDPFTYGVCKPPIAAGGGSGGLDWDIVPGAPDESILVYRIEGTEADVKMPELGRNLVHAEGVAAVRAWVTSLEGECGVAAAP